MTAKAATKGEDEIPMISYWKGIPINEDMSKQQLIEIINWLAKDVQSMRESHRRDMDFMSLLAKRRA